MYQVQSQKDWQLLIPTAQLRLTEGEKADSSRRSNSLSMALVFSLPAIRHQHALLFHCCKTPEMPNRIQTTSKLSSMTIHTSITRTRSRPHLGFSQSIPLCAHLKTEFNTSIHCSLFYAIVDSVWHNVAGNYQ